MRCEFGAMQCNKQYHYQDLHNLAEVGGSIPPLGFFIYDFLSIINDR